MLVIGICFDDVFITSRTPPPASVIWRILDIYTLELVYILLVKKSPFNNFFIGDYKSCLVQNFSNSARVRWLFQPMHFLKTLSLANL